MAGSAGQLGRALVERLGSRVVWAGGRDALDVRDEAAVRARVADARPDVVFNATPTTWSTAPRPEPPRGHGRERGGAAPPGGAALRPASVLGPRLDQLRFRRRLAASVTEDDAVRPLSVYGLSKRAGELAVMSAGGPRVVRTSALFGRRGRGGTS